MTDKKPRYCKCGHLSHPTHDTPKSILGYKYQSRIGCNGTIKINDSISIKCDCKRFLIESYPTKFDKVMNYLVYGILIFTIIGGIIFSGAIYQLLECKDPTCIKALSEKVFTEKQALLGIFLFILLGITWIIGTVLDVFNQDRSWSKREKKEHQE